MEFKSTHLFSSLLCAFLLTAQRLSCCLVLHSLRSTAALSSVVSTPQRRNPSQARLTNRQQQQQQQCHCRRSRAGELGSVKAAACTRSTTIALSYTVSNSVGNAQPTRGRLHAHAGSGSPKKALRLAGLFLARLLFAPHLSGSPRLAVQGQRSSRCCSIGPANCDARRAGRHSTGSRSRSRSTAAHPTADLPVGPLATENGTHPSIGPLAGCLSRIHIHCR